MFNAMNTLLRNFSFLLSLLCVSMSQAAQLPIILEAENARLFGDLKVEGVSGFSGNKYVHDFHINSDSYFLENPAHLAPSRPIQTDPLHPIQIDPFCPFEIAPFK